MTASAYLTFFFFNATATTEIYTLSLHDALPIWPGVPGIAANARAVAKLDIDEEDLPGVLAGNARMVYRGLDPIRSEEHTSELQSQSNLVCRLLLEKKKKKQQLHLHNSMHHTARD